MADITVRLARPDDASRLGEIGIAAWRKGLSALVPPDARERIGAETFEAFARTCAAEILVAKLAGAIAGFAATERGDNHITDLWVGPKHEGRGVGTALVAALEHRIAQRGFGAVEIEVMTANLRALELYLRLGYRPVREGPSHDATLQVTLRKMRLRKSLTAQDRRLED